MQATVSMTESYGVEKNNKDIVDRKRTGDFWVVRDVGQMLDGMWKGCICGCAAGADCSSA